MGSLYRLERKISCQMSLAERDTFTVAFPFMTSKIMKKGNSESFMSVLMVPQALRKIIVHGWRPQNLFASPDSH